MITPPDAAASPANRRTANRRCAAVAAVADKWAETPPQSRTNANDLMKPLRIERAYRAALKKIKTTAEERKRGLHRWTAAEWAHPEGGCAVTLWIAVTDWSFERILFTRQPRLPSIKTPPPRRHVIIYDCYMPAQDALDETITHMAAAKPGFLLGGFVAVDCGNNLLHNAAFRVFYGGSPITTTITIIDPTADTKETIQEWIARVQSAREVTATLRITEIAAAYR